MPMPNLFFIVSAPWFEVIDVLAPTPVMADLDRFTPGRVSDIGLG
jgi:hypothetical protein